MPIYHFHSANGERLLDPEGTELEDDARARIEAAHLAGAMLADLPETIWESGQWRIEVTDDDNCLLFTVIMLAIEAPKAYRRATTAS